MSFTLFRPDWMSRGKCLGLRPYPTFYPAKEDAPSEYVRAKAMCNGCPVREECLEYGVVHNEFGMWGGTSENERQSIRNRRAKARAKARREREQLAS